MCLHLEPGPLGRLQGLNEAIGWNRHPLSVMSSPERDTGVFVCVWEERPNEIISEATISRVSGLHDFEKISFCGFYYAVFYNYSLSWLKYPMWAYVYRHEYALWDIIIDMNRYIWTSKKNSECLKLWDKSMPVYAYVYPFLCVCIWTCTNMYKLYIHKHVHMWIYTCKHVHINIYRHVHMYVFCVCIHAWTCIYVYIRHVMWM